MVRPHLVKLCQALEDVESRKIKRLIISMPPRHGKSVTISDLFPSWYLGRHPDHWVIHTSYAATLSESYSRKVRNRLVSKKYKLLFGIGPAQDSRAVNMWNIEGFNGGMIAAGVGGAITGFGANVFIIDDPLKNRQEAESETYRERIWDWYKNVVRTRLEPGAVMIIVMTRWHKQDLVGKLLEATEEDMEDDVEHEPWTVMNFPAIAEEGIPDVMSRGYGEPLWGDRFSKEHLASTKRDVGSRTWNSLYQGNPDDPKSKIVKREWIRYYDELPLKCVGGAGIDTATKTKEVNDNTAMTEAFRCLEGYIYIDDVFLDKVSVAAFAKHVCSKQAVRRFSTIRIEDNAGGEAVKQRIEEEGRSKKVNIPIVGVTTTTDKVIRVHEIAPLIENGTVRFKRGNKRVAALIDHLVDFPDGDCDDDVDSAYFAIRALEKVAQSLDTKTEQKHKPVIDASFGDW